MGDRLEAIIKLREEEVASEGPSLYELLGEVDKSNG